MTPWNSSDRGSIYKARAEAVYPLLDPGSVSLVISDGPYGVGIGPEWDKMKPRDLPEWYAPHIEAWGKVCAPSASVYLWGTDEGEGYLRAPMRAAGWTFRGSITWDKGIAAMAGKIDTAAMRMWFPLTEACGVYQREAWAPATCAGSEIAYAAGRDDRNTARVFLLSEWREAGLRNGEADKAMGTNGMAGHYFGKSQWSLPTWEAYSALHKYAREHGRPRMTHRPYLVLSSVWEGEPPHDGEYLRASYDHLRAEYDHLRAEYEASRPAFTHPVGVGNVWRHGSVAGVDRLRGPDGLALHPCQKPLAFYDRIIRASSRPGELVLEPFGGTCRAAVACERLPRAEARRYVCVEPDEDGRGYLDAILPQLRFSPEDCHDGGQVGLF